MLVDDGSPDNCPKICEDFAAKYDNIRVIHQENRGLSGARNTGIDHARGSLITFADSDDTLHLDAVEKLYEQLETHGTAIATAGVTDDKPISGVFSAEEAIGLLLKETTNLTTAAYGKLFDIRLFDDIRFPEGLVFEDYATIPWLFAKAGAVAHTGEKLYDYRLNPDSITKAGFSPRQMQYFTVSDRVERFVEENYPKLRRHARNRKTQFSVALGYFADRPADDAVNRFLGEDGDAVRKFMDSIDWDPAPSVDEFERQCAEAVKLDVSHYANGVYIIHVRELSKHKYKKLVVRH